MKEPDQARRLKRVLTKVKTLAFRRFKVTGSSAGDSEALLAEFRALGGTAQNVRLGLGLRGRGIFPVDPRKPVRLHLPRNLLIPSEDTEIRNGRLVVKASATLGQRERAFFDRFQEEFNWGAGVFNELWQEQLAWSQLPLEIQTTLTQIGPSGGLGFSKPSVELCHRRYVKTRQTMYRGTRVVMPILELVNHASNCEGWQHGESGIEVSGMFNEEVVVNYGRSDCWGTAVNYGFCDARNYALSLRFGLKFEHYRIEITRMADQMEIFNGFELPIVRVADETIHFPFLTLGNTRIQQLPRAVFLHVTKNTPIKRPDELFDLIQHYNRVRLLKFLRVSEDTATSLVAMLRRAAYQQLETLSYHWGTRSLENGPASP